MSRLAQLQQFLKNDPNSSFIIFAIAKEYEKLGDEDNALAQYLDLLQKDPNYVGLYYHLAKLYEEKDEITRALDIYDKGMLVAEEAGDQHALNELKGAREMCAFEL